MQGPFPPGTRLAARSMAHKPRTVELAGAGEDDHRDGRTVTDPPRHAAEATPSGHEACVLVATESDVLIVRPGRDAGMTPAGLQSAVPTCLAGAQDGGGRAFCGLRRGLLRSVDGGATWRKAGLTTHRVTSVTVSPARQDLVWAGTEPSAVWRSDDGGERWHLTEAVDALPSAPEWAFPPRPETHHARWIACHPQDPARIWVAIEAGALIHTRDGGRSWHDRVPGGPYDTHELAIHPEAPERLRVAAGDGYYESSDGGLHWSTPERGLEVRYLRSVAIDPGDPEVVVVSAASHPHSAYAAGRSDGRLLRRVGDGSWERVTDGWPSEPSTIAPLLGAGTYPGELWAADERGVHRSADGGVTWRVVAAFADPPRYLMGLATGVEPTARSPSGSRRPPFPAPRPGARGE